MDPRLLSRCSLHIIFYSIKKEHSSLLYDSAFCAGVPPADRLFFLYILFIICSSYIADNYARPLYLLKIIQNMGHFVN